ncbi:LysR substrate-binding domain-containing protein [Pseudoduganella buxea]|uniref:LysR family transcriptional regulator n=1 Tax=Pseudoduganella buxea TaxID=1949069 RepID=A0A6I3SR84_9BURK|nr:LysR substrate-binding domain-containing protein [Pseudoduganella buxea]MTV51459.1 LysR family transcriptional regulator [Pseudoduganella buxea]GGB89166.1 LysR family transcriptional regulator [Pseudoduganella buxea]
MRFDLTDLKLFQRVAESGSITAGAAHAHLALASASARIRGMEDTLGVPLLVRGRRGVEPTAAGRTLLHHARLITQQMERMRADLGEYASGLKGHVRVLSNTSALTEFLPDVLAAFMAAHPHVNVDLEERLSTDIVQAMRDRLADIGIVTDAVDSSGLETRLFKEDRLVLAVGLAHPLAKGVRRSGALPFSACVEYDFIGLAGDSALQQYIGEQGLRLGHRLRYRVRLRSFDAICRMVASGNGLAVLPESAAVRSRDAANLKVVRLTDPWARRRLLLCMQSYAKLPGYARELADALAAPQP